MISGVSFGGLASGLDTEEIIASLLHLERAPIRQLAARVNAKVAEREAWQKVNMMLSQLDSTLGGLRDSVTFAGRTAVSSREDLLSASADPSAAQNTYEIEVLQLARAHRVASARFASAVDPLGLSGSFNIDGTVMEVGEDSSLSGIRDLINASDVGAAASIIDNRLVVTSDTSGYSGRLQIEDGPEGILVQLGIMTEVVAVVETTDEAVGAIAASDEGIPYTASQLAEPVEVAGSEYRYALHGEEGVVALSVDGSAYVPLTAAVQVSELEGAEMEDAEFIFESPVHSGTVVATLGDDTLVLSACSVAREVSAPADGHFTIDGLEVTTTVNAGIDHVIEGVSINLLGASVGTPITLHVSRDDERSLAAVRDFVDGYNAVQGYLGQLGARAGILQGDGTLMRLQTRLRQLVTSPVQHEGSGFTQVAQLGIQVDRHGLMSLDEAALRAALEADSDAVHEVFGASATEHSAGGVAQRLSDSLHGYLRSGDGLLTQRDRLYERMLRDFDDRREFLERRVLRREDSLRRQFAGLESMLSTMHSQGQWLEAQIQNLNSISRSGQ